MRKADVEWHAVIDFLRDAFDASSTDLQMAIAAKDGRTLRMPVIVTDVDVPAPPGKYEEFGGREVALPPELRFVNLSVKSTGEITADKAKEGHGETRDTDTGG